MMAREQLRQRKIRLVRAIARARGFTLLELMVAMTAGAIVSAAAFGFARAATKTFQQENRIANAMYANTLAFRRLVSDIQRSGFMSSPNIERDYQVNRLVCMDPSVASMPTSIQKLVGLRVQRGVNVVNGRATDRFTITGSFSNNEPFPVRTITATNGGFRILLQPDSGAMQRSITQNTGFTSTLVKANLPATTWTKLFPANRILRVVDQSGFQQFGKITGAGFDGISPYIDVDASPKLFLQGAAPAGVPRNPACTGVAGLGVGILANVVNRYVYEIASLKNFNEGSGNPYATLFTAPASTTNIPDPTALPGEDTRAELVRYEIDIDGNRVVGTTELVAEYAVDLSVRSLMVDGGAIPGSTLTRLYRDTNTQQFDQYLDEPTLGAAGANKYNSERVRSLQVRLVVRTREGDRAVGMTVPASPNEIARVAIPNTTLFARARTLQADVSLPNHAGVLW